MWCVIPAAGEGTRMGRLTASRPKPLLRLGEETLIGRIFRDVSQVVDRACVVVSEGDRVIRRALGRECHGVRIFYVEQREQRGVGDAICCCADVVTGPFVVIMGDGYFHEAVAPSLIAWKNSAAAGAVMVKEIDEPLSEPAGLVRVEEGEIRALGKGSDPEGFTHRVCGVFMYPPEVFEGCDRLAPSASGELEAEALMDLLIARGVSIVPIPYTGWRRNVNRPEDLEEVRRRNAAAGGATD